MGLLDQAQPQQPATQQQDNPPQSKDGQQSIYERIASMALNYVYSEQGANMVLEGLRLEHGDIVKNAGNIVAKILMRLIITARTSGGAIPPKVMLQVGMETAIAVLEIAESDGELPNAKPGTVDAVFYAAVTITGRELPDDILSAQERQEVSQTLKEVQQMQGSNTESAQAPQESVNSVQGDTA